MSESSEASIEAEMIDRIDALLKEFIRKRQEVRDHQHQIEDKNRDTELSEVDAHELNKQQELYKLRQKFDADVRSAALKQHNEQVQVTKRALDELEQGHEEAALSLLEESITIGENAIERDIKRLKKDFAEAKRKIIRDCAALVKATRDEAKRKIAVLTAQSDNAIDEATEERNQALVDLRNEYVRRRTEIDPDTERRAAFRDFTEILSKELTKNGLPSTKANSFPKPKSPRRL